MKYLSDMKSLSFYSKKMTEYQNQPHFLSSLLIEMSADYSKATSSKMKMVTEKSDFWLDNKDLKSEKPVSDKMIEMMFLKEGRGLELMRCELYLKAISKNMSSIQTMLATLRDEAKNQI